MTKLPKVEDWIILENDDLIAINKPPFIATLQDRSSALNVLDCIRQYIATAQVCHRLDKETTGVLLVAKNKKFYKYMARKFEARLVKKIYHSVVEGKHEWHDTNVDLPIVQGNKGFVRISHSHGKRATTILNTLQIYANHTLVSCQPITGRMHQIRIHLSALGAPICSDIIYGGSPVMLSSIKGKVKLKKWTEEQPLMKRVALHAASISFTAISGETMHIEAQYPKDLRALTVQLEKYR